MPCPPWQCIGMHAQALLASAALPIHHDIWTMLTAFISRSCRYGYRQELLELLTRLVRDMDRKIMRQKERAAKESESRLPTPPEKAQLDDLKVDSVSMHMTTPSPSPASATCYWHGEPVCIV